MDREILRYAQDDNCGKWHGEKLSCCPFILFTARNRDALPSLAGDHEDHPYGSPGLVPVFMASVDAY